MAESGPELDPDTLATISDAELARTLRIGIADFGDVARTIAQNPRSTIEPAQRGSGGSGFRRAFDNLGAARDERGIASGLDIERTLGEGGMGIVRLATQRSLGRKVAVKTVRPAVRSDLATLRLLREAWVTGTLEHPNIVPVYDLGLDQDGSPIIILKRIEGVQWGEIMRDKVAVRQQYGADDLLEYNLRILIQLSNAVSLAHARGVLHRDLKPENVMIGSFGEVYLVDWGIAVSLAPDPSGRLPLAAEQNEMAGTPCYMAPEMLGGNGALTEQTDVYLLGAILHEILAGAPPHNGSFKQIVSSIILSTFTYEDDVPRELAEIARRAMAREPSARFASAEELRLRLEWYLRHRGSLAISAEAALRLRDMRDLVALEPPPDDVHDRLYHRLAECRFGFRQALSASTDNQTARHGLRAAIEIIVRFELAQGAAEAAAGALAQLEDPPAELVAAVADALRARADEKQKMNRLEHLDAQLDPATGRRTRLTVAVAMGVVWTILPQWAASAQVSHPEYPWWRMYALTLGCFVGASFGVLWGRQSMMRTMVNRRLIASGVAMFALQLALEVGCFLLDVPKLATSVLHLLVWAASAMSIAMMIDRRFWWSTTIYVSAFFAACVYPAARFHLMSAANFALLVVFLIAWWRPGEDRPRFLRERG